MTTSRSRPTRTSATAGRCGARTRAGETVGCLTAVVPQVFAALQQADTGWGLDYEPTPFVHVSSRELAAEVPSALGLDAETVEDRLPFVTTGQIRWYY